tara:strand:+ start:18512 stop:18940 length:429 start_codon:yes stop_codon:yes gene_type:complete
MIHLVKLCVGAETVEDLEVWQSRRARERKARGEPPNPIHETRQTPKRVDELLDGGSIYWVIKGTILVRQAVLAVNTLTDRNGRNYCELVFDPELVLTEPQGRKAFQGWRYLKPEDAPADASTSHAADVPPELGRALREAGVW